MVILLESGARWMARDPELEEAIEGMVRVLVVGEHVMTLVPVGAALSSHTDVEVVTAQVDAARTGVDAVIVDQSLGASRVVHRLGSLAARHPDACLVVVSLHRADRYRWVRVLPKGAGFAVHGAGTDPLDVIVDELLGDVARAADDDHLDALPTMPRSIA